MNGIVHGVAESDRTERLSLYFLMKHTHNIILQVEDIGEFPGGTNGKESACQ